MTDEKKSFGDVADEIDNVLHATMLAIPAAEHLRQIRHILPKWRDYLRLAHLNHTSEWPWADQPSDEYD
jgi:hypothetical protein